MGVPFYSPQVLHTVQPLVDLCIAYDPAEDGYIRSTFFPRRPVHNASNLIHVIDKAQMLRLYDLNMAPNSIAPSVTIGISPNLQYTCKPFAARSPVNAYDVANADAALQFQQRATKQCLISMGQRMEYLAVDSTLRNTAVMTNNETLTNAQRLDNYASTSSDPVNDCIAAISQIRVKIGKANAKVKMSMHQFVWDRVRQHPSVINRVIFSGQAGAVVTKEIFAGMVGLKSGEDLVITAGQYTNSQEGETTQTFKAFIGPDVIFGFGDDGGLDDQALGHEFSFNGLGGDDPFFVRQYRVEQEGIQGLDYVQVASSIDYKITNVDASFLIKSVVDVNNTALYAGLL